MSPWSRVGQSGRRRAIAMVGGMVATLFLTRYLMPVLSRFKGHLETPSGAASRAH
jgi:cobalt-zinc-cadmium resistance protein CzcA